MVMKRNVILSRIEQSAIMAIVRVPNIEQAITVARGCLAGGVDCLEISYTVEQASSIISALNIEFREKLLVGAGTILDATTARLAIMAGAKFLIAPNFSLEVAQLANRYQIPYMPGCSTISEMLIAMEAGSAMIKAFPISNFYGASLIKVLKTPVPQMPILASGGVTLDNITTWLEEGVDCVGVGSLLTVGDETMIAQHARLLVKAVLEHRQKKL